MTAPTGTNPEADDRTTLEVAALVEDFHARLVAGDDPDACDVILAHPHLAAELEGPLAAVEALVRSAGLPCHPPAEPHRGTTIGRYKLLGILGRGTSAVVYRAHDPVTNRDVALKVFRDGPADEPGSRGRFARDAQCLAELRHPHIVPLHTPGRADGVSYLDMELVEGESLQQRLDRGPPLDPRAAARLVMLVAEALHYAHSRDVVHRDVKPSNILLDTRGEPQLTDFGLARRLTDPTLTAAGQVLGTPAYMPPEQAAGGARQADARSDVYSLGAVLYRLLTGRPPFEGELPGLLRQIAEQEPPRPRTLNCAVPRDLETISLKAIEKRPGDRFPTAGAFAEEMRRWLNGEPLTVRPLLLWERAWRRFRRLHPAARGLVVAAVGLCALSATLGVALVNQRTRADLERQSAALARAREAAEAEARNREQAEALLGRGWQRLRSTAVGRRREVWDILRELAAVRERMPAGELAGRIALESRSLFAASLGAQDLSAPAADRLELPESPLVAWPAAVHPDGRSMAVGLPNGPVRWARGDPPPTAPAPDETAPRLRLTYSPDGRYLACAPAGGGLRLWDGAVTRVVAELDRPGGADVLAVGFAGGNTVRACYADGRVRSWSLPEFREGAGWSIGAAAWTAARFGRSGDRLAAGAADGRVYLFRGGEPAGKFEGPTDRAEVRTLAWAPDGERIAVGGKDGTVTLRHRDGTLDHRFAPTSVGVDGLEFTPDGCQLLAGATPAGSMWVWDVSTGTQVLTGRGTPWGFAGESRLFVAGDSTGVAFCELSENAVICRLRGHAAVAVKCAWSEDGTRLATLDSRYEVRVWDARGGREVDRFAAPVGDFFAMNAGIALSADGRLLAYASGGELRAEALVRDVDRHDTVPGGTWTLPGGYEYPVAAGGRFLFLREEFEEGRQVVRTVVRELEAGRPVTPARVIRPSAVGDRRRFLHAGPTPDGRLYWWAGPREPPQARRVEVREVATGRAVAVVPRPSARLFPEVAVHLDPAGRLLWLGTIRPHLDVRDLSRADEPALVAESPVATVTTAAGDDWRVYPTRADRWRCTTLDLRDGVTGRSWAELANDDLSRDEPRTVCFNRDGSRLTWASLSGTVTLADLTALKRAVEEFEAGRWPE